MFVFSSDLPVEGDWRENRTEQHPTALRRSIAAEWSVESQPGPWGKRTVGGMAGSMTKERAIDCCIAEQSGSKDRYILF